MQAVLDRFQQVEPTVLLAVDGYRYGRRDVSRADELAAIRAGLPSLGRTVFAPVLERAPNRPTDVVEWVDVARRRPGRSSSPRCAADHPLYVLYSSGTTGLPKPIVHGHGGVLLEHLKVIGLHGDIRDADDRSSGSPRPAG